MSQSIEQSLLQAIQQDDKKAFNALMGKARCGTFCLGRFPVLSLMYLYKSNKLISIYEEEFLKISDFEVLSEPAEISKKFSVKAGKCLRLYINEIVSPAEMLLILDKTNHLKRIFPMTETTPKVKERLKSIYYIKYSLNVQFNGDKIIIDRRPLSYREKKNIATICLCSVLASAVIIGVPITTINLIPKPVEGEVTKLSQIDFNSQKVYTLKSDIELPHNYSVEKINCNIIGEGNKLVVGKGSTLGTLNGKLSDLTIESSGEVVFTSVSEKAVLSNIIVNVTSSVASTKGTAFVAETNYGTIDGVTVNVSGELSALAASTEVTEELTFGGIVQNNTYRYNTATQTVQRGIIKNCTVNYSRLVLKGEVQANAVFGGITGINSGYLQDCFVNGEIISETFDIAGVCSVNNGVVSGTVNTANLSQTSDNADWNPITCGLVLNNANAIENCENKGNIISVSDCGQFEVRDEYEPTVSAVGIAYLNRGSATTPYIKNCINSGYIECSGDNRNAYASGVCTSSSGIIESCENTGQISVSTDNGFGMYAGGITSITYGDVMKSVNEGEIIASGNGQAYIGGISAHSIAQLSYCFSSGVISVTAKDISAGGILGFSEVTRLGFYVYCGNVDYCISDNNITVTLIDETPAHVGGIVGFVRDAGFNSGDSVVYFGGSVTHCYFTGNCELPISYFGSIVGVSGANIYENNSFISGAIEYRNFENNYYAINEFSAFGAIIKDDGSYSVVEDKGATSETIENMKNSETYKSILGAIKSESNGK